MRKTIYICTMLFFALFINVRVNAEEKEKQPFEISAETNKKEIHIGDKIKLILTVDNVKGYELLFPEMPERIGDFTFIESYPVKSAWLKAAKMGRTYILTIYETGTHVIPPIQVKYKKKDENGWHTTCSPQVPIEVISLLTGNDNDIRDIKGLALFGVKLPWLIIILVIIACLSVFLGWLLWRRRKRIAMEEALRKRPAHEIAYEELRELKKKNLPGKGLVKEYYVELSGLIRRYLENRFYFRAPEMTTEEFLESIKESPVLTDDHKKLLREFLGSCDMVKFAKYGPTPLEMLDSFNAAERLVEQTVPEEPAEDEEEMAKK